MKFDLKVHGELNFCF